MVSHGVLSKMTPRLFAITAFMALGNIIYGYDTASFGGVQAIPAFGRQFGEFDRTLNRYALPARTSSLLTSLAFLGKFIGTLFIGPLTERYGHRTGMFVLCAVTIVGTIIQVTAKHAIQFLVGRIVVYIGVGIVENVVPTYQSEIAPARFRGPIVGSLQMLLACGALIASGVNRRYSTSLENSGWQIPVGVQMITPFVILCGLYFIPPSPRWLLYKGRRDEAIAVLESVRPKEDVAAGLCLEEVEALEQSLREESQRHNSIKHQKLGWLDLFRGTNFRRTNIATMGQAFTSQYGTVFYIRVGLAPMAFTYSVISTALSIPVCFLGMVLLEVFGRRPILVSGAFLQSLWLFLVAGIGGTEGAVSNASKYMMVAATMLFTFSFSVSWAPLAAEVGTGALREKTMAFSSMLNVVCAFAVSFTLPYLLNPPYANLQARVGYIYGSIAAVAMLYAFFFVPETKGRSLEELDELFERKPSLPAWRFKQTETTGVGAKIGAIEDGVGGKIRDEASKDDGSVKDSEPGPPS
ncbi:sugar transporter [Moniliophthora roreri]|nr:sugar transporter [Moniliophthora roreri]